MATNTLHDLHFELERSIARRVDSKLIGYQVSLSDGFTINTPNSGIRPIPLILLLNIALFILN